MRAMEIARGYISKSLSISALSILRYKVLFEFLKTINNKVKYSDVTNEDAMVEGGYSPPKSEARALVRVNKYVYNGIDKEKVTTKHKKKFVYLNWVHAYLPLSSSN